MFTPVVGGLRVALVAVPLLLASLAAETRAHGCHHRGDHGHDGSLVRAWLEAQHPDLTATQVERLLASPGIGSFFPAETAAVQAPPCPLETATTPPGWFAGDTHVHVQGCPPAGPGATTPAGLVADMTALDLDVVSGLVFGANVSDPDDFLANLAPLVTGAPDPASTSDHLLQFGVEVSGFSGDRHGHPIGLNIGPGQVDFFGLGLGCEPLYQQPDHTQKVNWIDYYLTLAAGGDPTEGVFLGDGSGARPAALFELFRQAPRGVTGWAHQMWPLPLYAEPCDGGWNWESAALPDYVGADIVCGAARGQGLAVPPVFAEVDFLYPAYAPFDVALGLVDFLEALSLDETLPASSLPLVCSEYVEGPVQASWSGLYDKLLTAGLRVAPGAGSDSPCTSGLICPPRTWVRTGGALPNYTSWTAGLAAGRVSLSSGGHAFLDLQVSYKGSVFRPGDQLEVQSASPMVRAQAVLTVVSDGSAAGSDVLELLVDGEVAAALPFGPLPAGESVVAFPQPVMLPLLESSWIAARTGLGTGGAAPSHPLGSTRTGAVWAVVDGQPQTECEVSEAFLLYADYLRLRLDELEAAAATGDLWDGVLLKALAGCEADRAAQREHLARGRAVFAAMRDHAHGTPPGVLRYGRSTYAAGSPPIALNVRRGSAAGEDVLRFTAFNAPPNQPLPGAPDEVSAWLVVSTAGGQQPTDVAGAAVYIDLTRQPLFVLPCQINSGGFTSLTVPVPSGAATLHAQLLVEAETAPAPGGPLTASDALMIQLGG